MSAKRDSDYDDRSSDGSDSEGSLVDFIMKSDDEEDFSEPGSAGENADTTLVAEFPYDAALLQEPADTSGPRRSRRQTKVPVRYVDDKYAQLMFDDVEMDLLAKSDEDEAAASNGDDEDEDEDYEQASDEDTDAEGSGSDDNLDEEWHDEEVASTTEPRAEAKSEAKSKKAKKKKEVAPVEGVLTAPATVLTKRSASSVGAADAVAKRSKVERKGQT